MIRRPLPWRALRHADPVRYLQGRTPSRPSMIGAGTRRKLGMAERYRIAIVGSGPGGISAAARAAERGEAHVLLEAEPHLSNTIFRYQKESS